ncbi:MAG: tRNA preQ1(34) S-adenosylmethionine ribosyltransferase-isomerase QueA [Actinobacteria bacterium]|nr:tRNA preQ1(34) S-adenosylmethionine ribosyltransferase-isomerase QueA [Actinomycetota bacterium]
MKLDLFDYKLPENLIAQTPLIERDKAKLLVLDKKSGEIKHDIFYNIINYINCNDVIVINESKVINARIFGKKEKTGAKIECFILEKKKNNNFIVLLRPSKRLKENDKVFIDENENIFFEVLEKLEEGRALINFNISAKKILEKYGRVPLPPYIKNRNFDSSFYQTVYAKKEGSVAAPTAGLHFTKELIRKLQDKGVYIAKVDLEIGLDTFKPIIEEDIKKHKIHTEKFSISESAVKSIINSKTNGGKVISVGTTTTRVLETIMTEHGVLKNCKGKTDLYIYPGYKFKIIDMLITNFHLPKSTLIVLVSAFAGRENILNAYKIAIENQYRFFSFGDCMLIK